LYHLIAYLTSKSAKCTAQTVLQASVPAGMARKISYHLQPRFKINTAGSTSSGELQTALLIGFQKQKRKL